MRTSPFSPHDLALRRSISSRLFPFHELLMLDMNLAMNEPFNAEVTGLTQEQRDVYGYEDHTPDKAKLASHVNFLEDCPPMPADRLDRKKRQVDRRGGACHSILLKSAVMASMASCTEDDAGDDNNGNILLLMQESLATDNHSGHSPRKRVRRAPLRGRSRSNTDTSTGSPVSGNPQNDLSVAQASLMLDSFKFNSDDNEEDDKVDELVPRRCPPVRRVSRRTSYEDRVKAHNTDDDDSLSGEA